MDLLKHLNEVNDVPVYSVESDEFKSYGNVLEGYDFSDAIEFMEKHTEVPEGNMYVASVPEMEGLEIKQKLESTLYGGMEIQIGYCNGKNSTYNGFEYHKGSEINVAVSDFMLCLAHTWQIKDNHIDVSEAKIFFVKKGTAIEMFQTTLHLSPLKVSDQGYRDIVVLPKGTNTPLTAEEKSLADKKDPEQVLLLQRNKWVIAHPEREPLIKQGAFPGLTGPNKELFY